MLGNNDWLGGETWRGTIVSDPFLLSPRVSTIRICMARCAGRYLIPNGFDDEGVLGIVERSGREWKGME